MNAEQIEILGTLRARLKELMSMVDKEKMANEALKRVNEELAQKIVVKDKKIDELEHKYDNLKIARSLVSDGEEMHDARIKVNRIVREIDKCIALLNR
jgi:superfamily I DNA and/or RNA helicase